MQKSNIPLFKVFMSPEVNKPLLDVIHSGYIGQGPKIEEFEAQLSNFLGTNKVLTVNSGTSALHLALYMSNVSGGYVITTPLTCSASNWPILSNGGKILWADIDPDTANISLHSVKNLLEKYGNKVKAILCVHWGGYPCELDELNELAESYNIPLIEDAAHAFGSEYRGKKIGNHSKFICFSFQAIKNLNTIDGGLLVTKSEDYYKRGKLLRWYGIDRENSSSRKDLRCEDDVSEAGFKFHMNDVNAVVGIENLKYIDSILSANRNNASFYNEKLCELHDGIKILSQKEDRLSSYWLYTIKVKNRDGFMRYMGENGVMVSKVHARNDLHSCVSEFKAELPNLDKFVEEMICIPVGHHVGEEERQCIINLIKRGW